MVPAFGQTALSKRPPPVSWGCAHPGPSGSTAPPSRRETKQLPASFSRLQPRLPQRPVLGARGLRPSGPRSARRRKKLSDTAQSWGPASGTAEVSAEPSLGSLRENAPPACLLGSSAVQPREDTEQTWESPRTLGAHAVKFWQRRTMRPVTGGGGGGPRGGGEQWEHRRFYTSFIFTNIFIGLAILSCWLSPAIGF